MLKDEIDKQKEELKKGGKDSGKSKRIF